MLTARCVQFYSDRKETLMEELLLREICEMSGVSRRAVQGYEKMGLVSSCGKNKMGHLLYDKKAQQKILQIKQFQEMGFTLREIKHIYEAPKTELRIILKKRLDELKKKSGKIDELIVLLEKLMEQL